MEDFQRFLQDIQSIYWWISVIIIGIVLTILGELAVRLLDRLGSRYIKAQREKIEQRKEKEAAEDLKLVKRLTTDKEAFHVFQTTAVLTAVQQLYLLILVMTAGGVMASMDWEKSIIPIILLAIFLVWRLAKKSVILKWHNDIFFNVLEQIEKDRPAQDDESDLHVESDLN